MLCSSTWILREQEMPIKDLEQSSWLNGPNASYIESFYESWLKDPASVSEQWRNYFAQMLMEDAGDISREALHSEIVTSLANRPHAGVVCDVSRQDLEIAGKQVFVQQLIAAYRVLGTRRAQLDPLKRHEAPVIPELDPDFYGLTDCKVSDRLLRHLLSVSEASTAPILNRYCKPVSTAQLLSAGFWQQMILKQIIDIFDILIVIFVNICNIVNYIKYYI